MKNELTMAILGNLYSIREKGFSFFRVKGKVVESFDFDAYIDGDGETCWSFANPIISNEKEAKETLLTIYSSCYDDSDEIYDSEYSYFIVDWANSSVISIPIGDQTAISMLRRKVSLKILLEYMRILPITPR